MDDISSDLAGAVAQAPAFEVICHPKSSQSNRAGSGSCATTGIPLSGADLLEGCCRAASPAKQLLRGRCASLQVIPQQAGPSVAGLPPPPAVRCEQLPRCAGDRKRVVRMSGLCFHDLSRQAAAAAAALAVPATCPPKQSAPRSQDPELSASGRQRRDGGAGKPPRGRSVGPTALVAARRFGSIRGPKSRTRRFAPAKGQFSIPRT